MLNSGFVSLQLALSFLVPSEFKLLLSVLYSNFTPVVGNITLTSIECGVLSYSKVLSTASTTIANSSASITATTKCSFIELPFTINVPVVFFCIQV